MKLAKESGQNIRKTFHIVFYVVLTSEHDAGLAW